MNKKLLFIPVVIGIVALIIIALIKEDPLHGNMAVMEVPSITANASSEVPKALTVILDNSGSMQGYVNFTSKAEGFAEAKQTMITNVADFMGNVDARINIVSTAVCGAKSYTSDKLIQAMRDYSAFSGAVTELNGLVENAVKLADDTAVTVIVSDMVLSYGKAAIRKSGNPNHNRQELPALSSLVGNQFKQLKKKDIGVLILKYVSDFNGKFYYNCTENIEPCEFKNTLMKKRPYYFFVIGQEKYIKNLCVNNCFPEPKTVFSTIELDDDDMIEQPFKIEKTQNSQTWSIGESFNPEAENSTICIWTKDNFGDACAKFNFVFDEIVIPLYARGEVRAEFDDDVISSVFVDQKSIKNIEVTLQPFEKLPKLDDDVEIELEVVRLTGAANSSVDVDYDVTADKLENKTWGFSSIIEKIYEAYGIEDGDTDTVAKLKFAISKK